MFASRISTMLRHAVSTGSRPLHSYYNNSLSPLQFNHRAFSQVVTFTFVNSDDDKTTVTAKEGQSLLDVAHENDVELEGACGGELACSTCHLIFEKRIFDQLPEMKEEEEDMLDLAWGLTDTSRLGCQIPVTKIMEGMTVRVPDETDNLM